VEVAHEALLREWPRLRAWLDESRADVRMQRVLGNAAAEWLGAEGDPSFLLRGSRLDQFEAWAAETGLALTADERAYLDASLEERRARQTAEAERQAHEDALEARSRRFLRLLVGVFAVAAVVAVVLSVVAFNQRQEALRQASIGLAALAVGELDTASPERSVLLALEALEHYPYTGQAESALANAVEAYHNYVILLNNDTRIPNATWSPKGERIVSTSIEGIIKIWDALTGEELTRFGERDFSDIRGVAWSADGTRIATASIGLKVARVWDAESGALLLTFEGHDDAVNTIALSRDGSLALTTSADGTARVWELGTGVERLVLEGHTGAVRDARWSMEEDRILTASMDGTVRLWDAETGVEMLSLNAHADGALSATWSPDGTQIATSGVDGVVRVWDVMRGQVLSTLIGHDSEVVDVDWSPDERHIATASWDGTIRVWDTWVGDELFALHGIQFPLVATWSPDGERLVAGGGFAFRVWDVSPETIRLWKRFAAVDAQWSPDMSLIATAGEGSLVRVWDTTTGELMTTFTGHVLDESRTQIAWFFSWSPSGEFIVTSGEDHAARIWNPITGEEHRTFLHDEFFIESADWSPDGTRIATGTLGDTGGPIYVWDVKTGELLNTFGHECFITEPSWSPDSKHIVSQCTAETFYNVVVWDAETGEQIVLFTQHTANVSRPDWSPDGKRIVSGGFDTTVRIWDAETGEEYLVFSGHNGIVWDAEWSPDGTRIASGDEDGIVRVWDAETGEEVYRSAFPSGVTGVEWSPDGKYIIIAGPFNVPEIRRVWLSTEELIAHAKECCVFRELIAGERQQFGLPEKP
jgi:WD40 repeat protein